MLESQTLLGEGSTSCTRPTTVGAISFGSACSYQLGATLAVFAAAGQSILVVPYVVLLVAATLVYTRPISRTAARSTLNTLLIEPRTFLTWPSFAAVMSEARGTVGHFSARRSRPSWRSP